MANEENKPEPDNRGSKVRPILISIIAVLVLLNGFFIYKYVSEKQEKEQTVEELRSSKELRKELNAEISDYEKEVKKYKGEVASLDSVVEKRKQDLEQKAERIRQLIEQKKITEEKYKKAREEIKTLSYYTKKYQRQIDSLYRVNKKLKAENVDLKENLMEEKKEKDQLEDKKVELENKVAIGSRLETQDIDVKGIKIRNNGNEKETMKINKMDKLRICFAFEENQIASTGERRVFLKLMDAEGQTLHIENQGSGKFEFKGDKAHYTLQNQFKFQNEQRQHCMEWGAIDQFEEGKYKVQVLTDSYEIGEKKFKLEEGFSLF